MNSKLQEYKSTFKLNLDEVQELLDLWQEDAEVFNDNLCPACGNGFDEAKGCLSCGFGFLRGDFYLPSQRSNGNWAEAFAEF